MDSVKLYIDMLINQPLARFKLAWATKLTVATIRDRILPSYYWPLPRALRDDEQLLAKYIGPICYHYYQQLTQPEQAQALTYLELAGQEVATCLGLPTHEEVSGSEASIIASGSAGATSGGNLTINYPACQLRNPKLMGAVNLALYSGHE